MTPAEIAASDAQYPRLVTLREQLAASGELLDSPRALGHGRQNANPLVIAQKRAAAIVRGSSSERDYNKERARSRQEQADFGEPYAIMEQEMERLAKQGNFRSDMFAYLQIARSTMLIQHRYCSRHVRNYLADKMTWGHFCKIEHSERPSYSQ